MFSGILTGIFLMLFLGGCIWLWRPALSPSMQAAAMMPLLDDEADKPASTMAGETP